MLSWPLGSWNLETSFVWFTWSHRNLFNCCSPILSKRKHDVCPLTLIDIDLQIVEQIFSSRSHNVWFLVSNIDGTVAPKKKRFSLWSLVTGKGHPVGQNTTGFSQWYFSLPKTRGQGAPLFFLSARFLCIAYIMLHVYIIYIYLYGIAYWAQSVHCRMLDNQLREDEFKADSFGGKRPPALGFEKSKTPSLTKPHLTSYLRGFSAFIFSYNYNYVERLLWVRYVNWYS